MLTACSSRAGVIVAGLNGRVLCAHGVVLVEFRVFESSEVGGIHPSYTGTLAHCYKFLIVAATAGWFGLARTHTSGIVVVVRLVLRHTQLRIIPENKAGFEEILR